MNRDEFTGKVFMSYCGDRNASTDIIEEYDRLKGALQTHEILLKTNVEEIDRLNNIINELEKYLIEMSDRSWDDNSAYDDVLDKLKELKENNER